jgi:hypothetical protein
MSRLALDLRKVPSQNSKVNPYETLFSSHGSDSRGCTLSVRVSSVPRLRALAGQERGASHPQPVDNARPTISASADPQSTDIGGRFAAGRLVPLADMCSATMLFDQLVGA